MARLVIFALALAAVAANDSVNVVDGNTNGFDGAPCAAEQTQCDDGACCATANWCCYGVVPPPYKTEMTVNGRTCYEKMRSDQEREQGQRRRGAARRHRPTRPRRRRRRRHDRTRRPGGLKALLST